MPKERARERRGSGDEKRGRIGRKGARNHLTPTGTPWCAKRSCRRRGGTPCYGARIRVPVLLPGCPRRRLLDPLMPACRSRRWPAPSAQERTDCITPTVHYTDCRAPSSQSRNEEEGLGTSSLVHHHDPPYDGVASIGFSCQARKEKAVSAIYPIRI